MARSSKRHRWVMAGGGAGGDFDPVDVTGGAVGAWYRVPLATVTGSGASSVPDVLTPGSPLVQATDLRRPPVVVTANGLQVLNCADDFMTVAAHAGNNQTVTWGWATWVRPDVVVGIQQCTIRHGVTNNVSVVLPTESHRIVIQAGAVQLRANIDATGGNVRTGSANGTLLTAGAWAFVTVEYDGAAATEALQCTITINGVVQTVTFTGAGAMPAALQGQPAGNDIIHFNQYTGAVSNNLDGQEGPNPYILRAKQAGATQGLLTTAGRAGLQAFEAPL